MKLVLHSHDIRLAPTIPLSHETVAIVGQVEAVDNAMPTTAVRIDLSIDGKSIETSESLERKTGGGWHIRWTRHASSRIVRVEISSTNSVRPKGPAQLEFSLYEQEELWDRRVFTVEPRVRHWTQKIDPVLRVLTLISALPSIFVWGMWTLVAGNDSQQMWGGIVMVVSTLGISSPDLRAWLWSWTKHPLFAVVFLVANVVVASWGRNLLTVIYNATPVALEGTAFESPLPSGHWTLVHTPKQERRDSNSGKQARSTGCSGIKDPRKSFICTQKRSSSAGERGREVNELESRSPFWWPFREQAVYCKQREPIPRALQNAWEKSGRCGVSESKALIGKFKHRLSAIADDQKVTITWRWWEGQASLHGSDLGGYASMRFVENELPRPYKLQSEGDGQFKKVEIKSIETDIRYPLPYPGEGEGWVDIAVLDGREKLGDLTYHGEIHAQLLCQPVHSSSHLSRLRMRESHLRQCLTIAAERRCTSRTYPYPHACRASEAIFHNRSSDTRHSFPICRTSLEVGDESLLELVVRDGWRGVFDWNLELAVRTSRLTIAISEVGGEFLGRVELEDILPAGADWTSIRIYPRRLTKPLRSGERVSAEQLKSTFVAPLAQSGQVPVLWAAHRVEQDVEYWQSKATRTKGSQVDCRGRAKTEPCKVSDKKRFCQLDLMSRRLAAPGSPKTKKCISEVTGDRRRKVLDAAPGCSRNSIVCTTH